MYTNQTHKNKPGAFDISVALSAQSNSAFQLKDNRPQSVFHKKGTEGQASQLVTQLQSTGNVIQRAVVGGAAPTIDSQLRKRFTQMRTEALITPKMVVDEVLALIPAGVAFPALPVHDQIFRRLTAAEIVNDALRQQMAEDNAGLENVDRLKHETIMKAMLLAGEYEIDGGRLIAGIDAIIDPLVSQAERAIMTDPARNTNPELRAAVTATTAGGDQIAKAATGYLAANARPAFNNELTLTQKTQLTAALRLMPVVIKMLAGTIGNTGNSDHLLKRIRPKDSTPIGPAVINNVEQALLKLSDMVDHHVLPSRDKIPDVEVNPDIVTPLPQTRWEKFRNITRTVTKAFRADANRDQNKVRISAMSGLDTIVHEFAHQIEFFLPVQQWLDIQELLRMRHAGGTLVSIYPDHSNPAIRAEPAFNATMPATGMYSAKAYDDGSTEVMSMTLEYFSTPVKAERMISLDPLQAAIILRIIKPAEFTAHVPTALRALLPRGDIAPPPAPAPAPVIAHPDPLVPLAV